MFYNQPLAIRFGNELLRHIDPYWDKLDVAVAWARASGMAHLRDQLASFLQQGGAVSIIVGIDLQNTTREGLAALLELESHGQSEIYVYHNEAGSIFHPKLYLFRNEEEARLIVGSNNLTEAGLYINVEAGLQVDTEVDASVITQALDALESWKDTASGLALRLDAALLAQLTEEGYVPDEAAARAQMQRRRSGTARRTAPLFKSRRFTAPPVERARGTGTAAPRRAPATAPPAPVEPTAPTSGSVLLMRLRKASVTDRPTQTQIPIRVVQTFFAGATQVRSAHSGEAHGIIQASARGGLNTIKLEIPEMRHFAQPMARFERTPEGIVYEAYDSGSAQGKQILGSLEAGLEDQTTQRTISDLERATWWRFI